MLYKDSNLDHISTLSLKLTTWLEAPSQLCLESNSVSTTFPTAADNVDMTSTVCFTSKAVVGRYYTVFHIVESPMSSECRSIDKTHETQVRQLPGTVGELVQHTKKRKMSIQSEQAHVIIVILSDEEKESTKKESGCIKVESLYISPITISSELRNKHQDGEKEVTTEVVNVVP